LSEFGGYALGRSDDDMDRAVFATDVFAFLEETQPRPFEEP
jgi:hypothetical protein